MLIDGPVEWAEASVPTGNKLDLLRHAYNPQLAVAALPKDATVVLSRYSGDSGSLSTSDEVLERAAEEVTLHANDGSENTNPDAFRYVSWSGASSKGSSEEPHYVAIATTGRLEIWQVRCDESLEAILMGSHSKNRIRGVCWNPTCDMVVVYNDMSVDFVEVSRGGGLRVHSLDSKHPIMKEKAKQCVWSPCGLSLARSSEKSILFFSWHNRNQLPTSEPTISSYLIDSPSPGNLLTTRTSIGSICASALLSTSVCVIGTDLPLVLEDIAHNGIDSDNASESRNSFPSTNEKVVSGNMIDLTSLRITASSKPSLFSIIDQAKITPQQANGAPKRNGHFVLVAKDTAGQWQLCSQLSLDQFAIPDVLDVEAMCVVVGSTISNRIITIHLDHSLKSGWSASVSGELKLSEGHVCRGLRLAKTSPFVQVASTEKAKRTFFHVSSGPQRIHLSKYKVPRRRRPTGDHLPPIAVPTTSVETNQKTPSDQTTSDGFAAVLSRMEALQSLMVSRFDQVERRLDEVDTRLARLEATRLSL